MKKLILLILFLGCLTSYGQLYDPNSNTQSTNDEGEIITQDKAYNALINALRVSVLNTDPYHRTSPADLSDVTFSDAAADDYYECFSMDTYDEALVGYQLSGGVTLKLFASFQLDADQDDETTGDWIDISWLYLSPSAGEVTDIDSVAVITASYPLVMSKATTSDGSNNSVISFTQYDK